MASWIFVLLYRFIPSTIIIFCLIVPALVIRNFFTLAPVFFHKPASGFEPFLSGREGIPGSSCIFPAPVLKMPFLLLLENSI